MLPVGVFSPGPSEGVSSWWPRHLGTVSRCQSAGVCSRVHPVAPFGWLQRSASAGRRHLRGQAPEDPTEPLVCPAGRCVELDH